jgi:hypothetical protein
MRILTIANTTALLLFALVTDAGLAATLDLGTAGNATSWLITGGGATMAPAFQLNCSAGEVGCISVSSNGMASGTLVTGFSANNSGFWFADRTFSIPAGATNISLAFSGLSGDDRVVLELNGTIVASFCCAAGQVNGNGIMMLDGVNYVNPFDFTNVPSGTVNSGFIVGGTNTLRLIENNTNALLNSSAPNANFALGDEENAGIIATLTYTPAIPPLTPAPSSLLLMGVGMVALLGWAVARRRRNAA